jgi:hypothetical protein
MTDKSHRAARLPEKLPKVGEPVVFVSTRGVRRRAVVVEVSDRFSAVRVSMSRADGTEWTGWRKFPSDFTEEGAAQRKIARADKIALKTGGLSRGATPA